jgi:hypothetical protein
MAATSPGRRKAKEQSTPGSTQATAVASPYPTLRGWLRDNTYVDLRLPFEKIGMLFEKGSLPVALSNDEKEYVLAELSTCEPKIRAGNLHVLEVVLEVCNRCALPAPVWLLPYLLETINKLLCSRVGMRKNWLQREIHQVRWATVHHLRSTQGLPWEEAWARARKELAQTRAEGSEETMRASYKWMIRHPFIASMRRDGQSQDIDEFARGQYKNRHAISERLIFLEERDVKRRKLSRSGEKRRKGPT